MSGASLRRGALALTAAGLVDFALQCLLPVALVRLLPPSGFADYRLAWLAIGTAMAVAPLALPRSLFYFLPRLGQAARAAYVRRSVLLLLASGTAAGLLLGPWNALLPASLRAVAGAAWFLPLFLAMWVAASLIEFLPNARGDPAGQARLIVALALLRVLMVGAAAWFGQVTLVFTALLAYAAVKLALLLAQVVKLAPAVQVAQVAQVLQGAQGAAPAAAPDHVSLRTQLCWALPFGLSSALFLLRGQADQWVAAALFPPAAFAAFSIGAVILPVAALVRNSVSNAIAPRLSALESTRDQAGMLRLNQRANLASAFVLLPALALAALLAPHLVALLYTDAYLQAAAVLRLNALALVGVAVEVSTLTVVLGQGRFLLAVDAAMLGASLAVSLAGALLFGLAGAALGNVLTLFGGNALSFWRVARVTGVPLRSLQRWDLLLRIALAALAAAGATALLDASGLLRRIGIPPGGGVGGPLATPLILGIVFSLCYVLLLKLLGLAPEARALLLPRLAPASSPAWRPGA